MNLVGGVAPFASIVGTQTLGLIHPTARTRFRPLLFRFRRFPHRHFFVFSCNIKVSPVILLTQVPSIESHEDFLESVSVPSLLVTFVSRPSNAKAVFLQISIAAEGGGGGRRGKEGGAEGRPSFAGLFISTFLIGVQLVILVLIG